jgi:hypothetical protein
MELVGVLGVGVMLALIVARLILRASKPSSYTIAHTRTFAEVRGSREIERVSVPADCLDILPEDDRLARREMEIVGESHYQAAIALCRECERVVLIRQPNNPYDKNAVVVTRVDGSILGYISREKAPSFARHLDSGLKIYAEIHGIYGGTRGKPSRGVWLDVYRQRKRRKPRVKATDSASR